VDRLLTKLLLAVMAITLVATAGAALLH